METKVMQDIVIVFKSLLLLCVAWFTELFISNSITVLTILPYSVIEFFEETKTALNWIVSFAVLILTVVKIIKVNKKSEE